MRFHLSACRMILAPGPAIRRGDCRVQQFQLVFRLRHRRCRPSVPAQMKANWEAFFSGTTSAAKKISLLQNGQKFAAVIEAQAGSGLAKSASAKVTAVSVTSPTEATVTYDILLAGKPALTNQTGQAVYQDGTWKVGDASFCALLALENGGKAPSVCSSAG